MGRKLMIWGSWAVVAAFIGYAGFIVGRYSGRSYQIQLEASRDVLRLYEYFRIGDINGANKEGLLTKTTVESAKDTERKLGRVIEARIERVTTGPTGLPVIVQVSVTRKLGLSTEYVARHGAAMNTLEFWGPLANARSLP